VSLPVRPTGHGWDSVTGVRSAPVSIYEFLSPEWIDAALALRDEYADRLPEPPATVRMNLVVTSVPHHGDDEVAASVDTGAHGLLPMLGHLDDPELTVTLEYEVAKSLFVGQDPEAVGKAFFGGRIRIDGDLSRLFLLQSLQATDEQRAIADQVNARLLEMTA
jgi:hypothetical protein